MEGSKEGQIRHGTPEEYFEAIEDNKKNIPGLEKDLNPWAVGCYTPNFFIKYNFPIKI